MQVYHEYVHILLRKKRIKGKKKKSKLLLYNFFLEVFTKNKNS